MKPLKKQYLKFIPTFCLLLLSLSSTGQEESFQSFDSIVDQLTSTRTGAPRDLSRDLFADILFHSGVGMTTSHLTLRDPAGGEQTGFMKGVEINLGIDLFSKNWLAEGSFRSFGAEEFSNGQVDLNEFDLKLVYHNHLAPYIRFRTGGGLAARYLQYIDNTTAPGTQTDYTTPSSLFFAGIQAELSRMMSVGLELSYRTTMIDETIDHNAFDASVRVDAHF